MRHWLWSFFLALTLTLAVAGCDLIDQPTIYEYRVMETAISPFGTRGIEAVHKAINEEGWQLDRTIDRQAAGDSIIFTDYYLKRIKK